MAGSLGIGIGLGGSVGGGNNNSYAAVAGLLWELPSELVLNGDFEELGDELVTNGDFSNGSSNWSNNDGSATFTNNYVKIQSQGTTLNRIRQANITQVGKTYKLSYEVIENNNVSLFKYYNGTAYVTTTSTVGTHTIYFIAGANDDLFFNVADTNTDDYIIIDNVSVKQVDPNNRWSLSSTFEIDNGKLHCVSDGSYQYAYQGNAFVVGNTYKITFDIVDWVSGSIRVRPISQSPYETFNANGTYTLYVTATSTTLAIERESTCDLYVDNVSIKEFALEPYPTGRVSDYNLAWDLDGLNYMPQASPTTDGNWEVVLGDELIQNGDFEELGNQIVNISSLSGDNWTADGDGGFTNNGSGEGLSGSLDVSTIVGKTYKFTFDVTISGIANATFGGVTIPIFTTSGSKEYYVTATSSSTSFSFYLAPSGSPSMFVNNVSVQQVDPNDRWTLGTGWSVEDGVAVASNSSANATQETFTIDAAKTYKIDFTISDYGGGTFFITFGGNDNSSNFTANGSYTVYITPTNRVNNIFYLRGSGFTGKIDNVSVKEGGEIIPKEI